MIKLLIKAPVARFVQMSEKTDCSTYQIPTPSSLIGLLNSIHGKPEFNWEVRSIKVLNEIKVVHYMTRGWLSKGQSKDIALCNGSYLKDVAYVVTAQAVIPPYDDNIELGKRVNLKAKHENILRRRVKDGRCGSCRGELFLGRHDCHCTVELLTGDEPKSFYEGSGKRVFSSVPYVQSYTRLSTENVHDISKIKKFGNKIVLSPFRKHADEKRFFISDFHYADLTMVNGLITIDPKLYEKHTTNNSY